MTEKKVWLITGAGRGLGVDIAKAALRAGHAVVATGRDDAKVAAAVGDHEELLAIKRPTLENARRYDNGLVPTTAPKCSRITAAEPKPAAAATRSIARSVVSSNRCARRTRAYASQAAGVAPTCSRKRRL